MQNTNDSTLQYTQDQINEILESINNFFNLVSAAEAENSLYSMLHSALASSELEGIEAANALSTVRGISELLKTLQPPHFVMSATQIVKQEKNAA